MKRFYNTQIDYMGNVYKGNKKRRLSVLKYGKDKIAFRLVIKIDGVERKWWLHKIMMELYGYTLEQCYKKGFIYPYSDELYQQLRVDPDKAKNKKKIISEDERNIKLEEWCEKFNYYHDICTNPNKRHIKYSLCYEHDTYYSPYVSSYLRMLESYYTKEEIRNYYNAHYTNYKENYSDRIRVQARDKIREEYNYSYMDLHKTVSDTYCHSVLNINEEQVQPINEIIEEFTNDDEVVVSNIDLYYEEAESMVMIAKRNSNNDEELIKNLHKLCDDEMFDYIMNDERLMNMKVIDSDNAFKRDLKCDSSNKNYSRVVDNWYADNPNYFYNE